MARTLKSDKWLFVATLLLVATGIVMVYSASAMYAVGLTHNPKPAYYFLFKQSVWAFLGLVAMAVTMRLDYRVYRQPIVIWSAFGAVVIALTLALLSSPVNGSRRWLSLEGLTVQPSEFAKLAIVLFAAALLERRMHRINDIRYSLVPLGAATLVFVLLVYPEPDFGASISLIAFVAAMIFVAGLSWRYMAIGLGLLAPAAALVVKLEPYRVRRLLAFMHPEQYAHGAGFHPIQLMIAVGSGGTWGRGLMGSVQKLGGFLPEPHTDSIFAIISEELGLVGSTLILALFCVVAWRGLRAAVLAPDRFGALLAVGLTMMISAQAFVNVSMVLGLLPNKGIALPFISSGGSSLLTNLIATGILLNISQQASFVAARRTGDLTLSAPAEA
jgi:cell division protein FtsW